MQRRRVDRSELLVDSEVRLKQGPGVEGGSHRLGFLHYLQGIFDGRVVRLFFSFEVLKAERPSGLEKPECVGLERSQREVLGLSLEVESRLGSRQFGERVGEG